MKKKNYSLWAIYDIENKPIFKLVGNTTCENILEAEKFFNENGVLTNFSVDYLITQTR